MSAARDDETLTTNDFDADQSVSHTRCSRRRLVSVSIVVAAVSLAGCTAVETEPLDGTDDGSDNQHQTGVDRGVSSEDTTKPDADVDDAKAVVREYLLAAWQEDVARMSELGHSQNPLDPVTWINSGWGFSGSRDEAYLDAIDIAVINDEATVDDIFELADAALWFESESLADELDGEHLVVIEVTSDDPTEDDIHCAIATENNEWHYLFGETVDSTPENPEELFEAPIEDENDDVVDAVNWEFGPDDECIVAVRLTDDRGIDATRIELETTIENHKTLGENAWLPGRVDAENDNDEFTATWEGGIILLRYSSEGDQLVVTAIDEKADESEIVHREHVEPQESVVDRFVGLIEPLLP